MRNKERKKLNETPFKRTPIKELTEEAVDSSSSFKWERVSGRGPKQFNWVADNIDAEIIKKIATKRNWDFTKRTTKDGREVWIFGGSFNPFALYDPTDKWLYVQDAKTKAKFHESVEYLEDDSFDESFDWSVFGRYAPPLSLKEEAKDPSTFAKGLDFNEFTDELIDWWHQAAAEYLGSNDKSAIEDLMSFVGDMDADEAEEKLYKLYKKGRLEKGDIFSAFEEVFDQASERQEDPSEAETAKAQAQAKKVYKYLETHHKKAALDYVQKVGRAPDSYSDEELSAACKDPKSFAQQAINNTLLPFEEYFQQQFPTVFNEKYWAKWTFLYTVDYIAERLRLHEDDDPAKRGEYMRSMLDPWHAVIRFPLLFAMNDNREQMSLYSKLKPAMSGKQQKRKLIADASEMEDDEDDEFAESFDWSVFGKYAPLPESLTLNEAPFLGDVDDYDDETLAADLKRISTTSLLRKYPAIAALQKLMGLHLEYQGLSSAFKYVSRDMANAEVLQSPYKGATLQVYIGGIYEASYDEPGSGLAKQSWYVAILPKEGSTFWYQYKNPSKVNEKKLKELQNQIDAELGITKLDNKALTKQLEKQVKQICDTFDESSAWSGKSSGGWTIEVKEWKDHLVCRAVAKELPLAFYSDPDSDATEVQWRGVNTSNEKETDPFSITDRLKLVMAVAQIL